MTHGSLFSGIGGFDLGFEKAGIHTIWQVEIDPFCQDILRLKFPKAKLFPDIKLCGKHNLEPVEVITGGFPCQDLSWAGRRRGLSASKSSLFFEFARIIGEVRPRFFVVENVPGLLTSNGGEDLSVILESFIKFGYGLAWRILDSQHFGVAQKRRRVFIVGSFGDSRSAKILFEPDCGQASPYKIKKKRSETEGATIRSVAGTICASEADFYYETSKLIVCAAPNAYGARTATRISRRMDKDTRRYRALGNAVTVNVAEWIAKRIIVFL